MGTRSTGELRVRLTPLRRLLGTLLVLIAALPAGAAPHKRPPTPTPPPRVGERKGSPDTLVEARGVDVAGFQREAAAAEEKQADEGMGIVEAVGAAGDGASFTVEAFDAAVVQA